MLHLEHLISLKDGLEIVVYMTYAPMDLFDWLDIIKKLREEGLTQAQIGELNVANVTSGVTRPI